MGVPFHQVPLIRGMLTLLETYRGCLATIRLDSSGDLNRYKEEYQQNIDSLEDQYRELWNHINESADAVENNDEETLTTNEPHVVSEPTHAFPDGLGRGLPVCHDRNYILHRGPPSNTGADDTNTRPDSEPGDPQQ